MSKCVSLPGVIVCNLDQTSGPRGDCPNPLHDHPLPLGYIEAGEVARKRLRKRWSEKRCPDCRLFGWIPPVGDDR